MAQIVGMLVTGLMALFMTFFVRVNWVSQARRENIPAVVILAFLLLLHAYENKMGGGHKWKPWKTSTSKVSMLIMQFKGILQPNKHDYNIIKSASSLKWICNLGVHLWKSKSMCFREALI